MKQPLMNDHTAGIIAPPLQWWERPWMQEKVLSFTAAAELPDKLGNKLATIRHLVKDIGYERIVIEPHRVLFVWHSELRDGTKGEE